jgi:hypothetical protein
MVQSICPPFLLAIICNRLCPSPIAEAIYIFVSEVADSSIPLIVQEPSAQGI